MCRKFYAANGGSQLYLKEKLEYLPELKQACMESPYFKGFDYMYWFRDCPYYKDWDENWHLANKAIRDAVLEQAIKKVSKLSWLEKCFIW